MTIELQAKEAAKKAGLDLRSNKAKEFVRKFIEKHTMVAVGECLCGCAKAPASIKSIFVQGHDAKLKSRALRGEKISAPAMRYIEMNWPNILDRYGSRAKKSA